MNDELEFSAEENPEPPTEEPGDAGPRRRFVRRLLVTGPAVLAMTAKSAYANGGTSGYAAS